MSARFTPGPWRWEVNNKSKQVQLCGGARPKFDLTVMGFRRWGMGGAAPAFINERLIMQRADELTEVVPGREHHANWFQTINHPDAHLIAAAPRLFTVLDECPLPSTMGTAEEHYRRFYAWYNGPVRAALAEARGEA